MIYTLFTDFPSRFEAEIRSYTGDDPLDPWHRYIGWVEQSFPKGGKEANLAGLVEKAIKEFKDHEVCNQDPRYAEIWIKYVSST